MPEPAGAQSVAGAGLGQPAQASSAAQGTAEELPEQLPACFPAALSANLRRRFWVPLPVAVAVAAALPAAGQLVSRRQPACRNEYRTAPRVQARRRT